MTIFEHMFWPVSKHWGEHNFWYCIGCDSNPFVFEVSFFSSRTPQTIGNFLEVSIARLKCLCVPRKVVLWPKHVDIIMLVPTSYLKLWNYICIYIYCPSRRQRETPGHRGRPRETTEASSRAQILAQCPEFSPRTTPSGPLNLRLFGKYKHNNCIQQVIFSSYGSCQTFVCFFDSLLLIMPIRIHI